MTLLLQPVFIDLHASNGKEGGGDQEGGTTTLKGSSPQSKTNTLFPNDDSTEDSLYSMWKVATKVKSVMADGARFENLTWRAWYRKSQLDKVERERRELENELEGIKTTTTLLDVISRSQATAIPRQVTKPTTTYNSGYSSILAEIQQASVRLNVGQSPRFMLEPPSPKENNSTTEPANTTKCSTIPSSNSSDSSKSQLSAAASTNPITQASRRRKKNVDKFIKKQQLNQLEKIAEQVEECKTAAAPNLQNAAPVMPAGKSIASSKTIQSHMLEYSSISTNDTASAGSVGEIVNRPKMDNFDLFRRPERTNIKNNTPSPHSDRPSVSLLTILLNRSAEAKRPESCPPPIFSTSPPNRPGAPLPSGGEGPSPDILPPSMLTQDRATSTIPSRAISSPPRKITSDMALGGGIRSPTPVSRDHSGGGVPTTTSTLVPSLAPPPRRRGIPNPAEFATPLYIW